MPSAELQLFFFFFFLFFCHRGCSGYDMTTEAACAKLSYLIGNGYTGKTLKRMIEMPLAGEGVSLVE